MRGKKQFHPVRKNTSYFDYQSRQKKNHSKKWASQENFNVLGFVDSQLLLKPGYKTVFLISLLLVSTVSAQQPANLVSKPQKNVAPDQNSNSLICKNPIQQTDRAVCIESLINQRLVVDTVGTNLNHTFCVSKITENIAEAIEIFPHTESYISRVLHNEGLKIVCTTPQKIKNKAKNMGANGFFAPSTGKIGKIVFPVPKSERGVATINHEFMHADTIFRHCKQPCDGKNSSNSIVPVHPYNFDNIQEYHKAFDAGDARLEAFGKLRSKKKSGEQLSLKESELLERYTGTSKSCFFDIGIGSFASFWLTPARYEILKLDKDFRKGNIYFFPTSGAEFEVMDIVPVNDQFEAILRPIDIMSQLVRLPATVKGILKYYSDHNIKIAERETHTFQYLSEEAMRTFYSEAYELRQIYISRCVSADDQVTICSLL